MKKNLNNENKILAKTVQNAISSKLGLRIAVHSEIGRPNFQANMLSS